MQKSDNDIQNKKITSDIPEETVAYTLSNIYFNYTFNGIILSTDSAKQCLVFDDCEKEMLDAIKKEFGISLSCFDSQINKFINMPFNEVLKLVIDEIRTKTIKNTIHQQNIQRIK